MISIGELSRLTGVKVPTIRYYEEVGLLATPGRTAGNQRRYGEADVETLGFIRHARELGFPVPDIRDLLELSAHPELSCAEANRIATRQAERVRARIERLTRLEAELGRIALCDETTVGKCEVLGALHDHGQCGSEH